MSSDQVPRRGHALRVGVATTLLGAALAAVATGCGARDDGRSVVLYVAHDLLWADPVVRLFEARTGIRVRVVGDTEATKTTGLFNRLLQLRDRPEADVFWNNEAMRMAQLAEAGLLQAFVPGTAVGIPARWCDPAGRWVGFAARARVILWNRSLLSEGEAPRSIFDLAAPRFRGKVALANPLFGTTATHVAALFATLGPEKARAFLEALRTNEVRIVAGNAMARNLVMDGELPVCLTDTDDANDALEKGKPVGMVFPDQDDGGLGALVIPNTVGLVAGAPHPELGRRLVEFLASAEVESMLARSTAAQLPLRDGVEPHDSSFDLRRVRTMAVDWTRVAAEAEESAKVAASIFLR